MQRGHSILLVVFCSGQLTILFSFFVSFLKAERARAHPDPLLFQGLQSPNNSSCFSETTPRTTEATISPENKQRPDHSDFIAFPLHKEILSPTD